MAQGGARQAVLANLRIRTGRAAPKLLSKLNGSLIISGLPAQPKARTGCVALRLRYYLLRSTDRAPEEAKVVCNSTRRAWGVWGGWAGKLRKLYFAGGAWKRSAMSLLVVIARQESHPAAMATTLLRPGGTIAGYMSFTMRPQATSLPSLVSARL